MFMLFAVVSLDTSAMFGQTIIEWIEFTRMSPRVSVQNTSCAVRCSYNEGCVRYTDMDFICIDHMNILYMFRSDF